MSRFLASVLCAILLSHTTTAAPAASSLVPSALSYSSAVSPSTVSSLLSAGSTSTAAAAAASPTVPYASNNPNGIMWNPDSASGSPQPIRGNLGASILGPQNVALDIQNPDILAPPTTDAGTVGNAKWPMSLSSNRLQTGGWARQQNVALMPMATAMAGVNMRLEAGAVRELHWHQTAEGYTQISSVDPEGRNYLATVGPGDLWYFPAGVPHSLQATAESVNGTEFLLVFPDGSFSEDSTFMLTDWTAHIPKEVLAKNFQVDISAFDNIPSTDLYIFPSSTSFRRSKTAAVLTRAQAAPSPDATAVEDPQGQVPQPYTYSFSNVTATPLSGGSVKIADSTSFAISTQIAVAEVTVAPGAMSEGQGRMTLFASSGNARTYNYEAGDVSYTPATYDRFQDISLAQWLALTPPALVQAHLQLSDEMMSHLNKTKQIVVGPASTA
ncbi:hypothetical protein PHLCEN_2v8433 [Hermanssonia centrifuga]|uniref:Cupin type-1 domain-containing protein n=1 Tax=Hermanssonia centrifuga TaxID=98765 RepID=A0A2R6NTS9_9APHY|nr:hypothetical protein PHLCEN_2v8433 [Hermanssonia centrifuga]